MDEQVQKYVLLNHGYLWVLGKSRMHVSLLWMIICYRVNLFLKYIELDMTFFVEKKHIIDK